MKITDIKVTPIAIPLKSRPRNLYDARPGGADYMPSVLVEIFTDEGITGIGESHIALGADMAKLILESVRNVILDENPMDVEVIKKRLYAACNLTHLHLHAANWALSGIDMALWDIVGKASGRSLHQIWGGAFRKRIQYYGYIVRTDLGGISQQAKELLEEGFKTIVLEDGLSTQMRM